MIAIDLGSNTIRFIEFDGNEWGKSFEKVVRTAEAMHQTGKIGEHAIERILSAIQEAKEHMNFDNTLISAVTTAAMRMAENQAEVLQRINNESGVSFTVIDGETEAKLTLKAVRYRLNKLGFQNEPFVLIDIGGGSTECIAVKQDQITIQSFNTGIVTLSEKCETIDQIKENLLIFAKKIYELVSSQMDTTPFLLIFTAGTPTTIAAYLNGMDYSTYNPDIINGYRLSLSGCRRAYDELMGMSDELRQKYVGVGRENLIATGILIVEEIFNVLGKDESIIIDDGLREGVALEYFFEDKTPHLT